MHGATLGRYANTSTIPQARGRVCLVFLARAKTSSSRRPSMQHIVWPFGASIRPLQRPLPSLSKKRVLQATGARLFRGRQGLLWFRQAALFKRRCCWGVTQQQRLPKNKAVPGPLKRGCSVETHGPCFSIVFACLHLIPIADDRDFLQGCPSSISTTIDRAPHEHL